MINQDDQPIFPVRATVNLCRFVQQGYCGGLAPQYPNAVFGNQIISLSAGWGETDEFAKPFGEICRYI
ncbi:MAG: hypothetical protein HQM08_16720 [Candidatus Riflebacteria bacterium]|nr:hypothetical protein [Candidatus Riflebacteria bacterium]